MTGPLHASPYSGGRTSDDACTVTMKMRSEGLKPKPKEIFTTGRNFLLSISAYALALELNGVSALAEAFINATACAVAVNVVFSIGRDVVEEIRRVK